MCVYMNVCEASCVTVQQYYYSLSLLVTVFGFFFVKKNDPLFILFLLSDIFYFVPSILPTN